MHELLDERRDRVHVPLSGGLLDPPHGLGDKSRLCGSFKLRRRNEVRELVFGSGYAGRDAEVMVATADVSECQVSSVKADGVEKCRRDQKSKV